MIYMDNAATMPMKEVAIQEMQRCIKEVYANPSAAYRLASKARSEVHNARTEIAKCIGADTEEIIFTSSGSEANSLAIQGYVNAVSSKGNHIIVSTIEHSSVLENIKRLQRQGYIISYIKPDRDGIVSAEAIRSAICPDTILVSVMYANNEIGSIQPIQEIGRLLKNTDIVFHTDAVAAAGYVDINVNRDNIDLLSVSGHKVGGAKGTGFLYKRKTVQIEPIILGGDQENGYRAGTENVAGIAAMRAAFVQACQTMENTILLLRQKQQYMMELLQREIPSVIINGSLKKRLPGNVHISIPGISADRMLMYLDMEGICASSGSACMNKKHMPSYVMKEIGAEAYEAGTLRLTLSVENTKEDIEYVVDKIKKNLKACIIR
ncbi:MAG: cysteine desulfurase [Lachnospiraceae bacterium]|nr:cysteine desulfurase [Lachnospiraceae bacterium]